MAEDPSGKVVVFNEINDHNGDAEMNNWLARECTSTVNLDWHTALISQGWDAKIASGAEFGLAGLAYHQ